MEKLVQQPDNNVVAALQSVNGAVESLFQAADLFPIPIQVFATDGITVFANQAALEMWNVSDTSQIVGRYNLLKDPIVNERMGYFREIRRIFEGEILIVPDVKVPLDAFAQWYQARGPKPDVESMYTDILNFPVRQKDGAITHIVSVFVSTRMYLGKADIVRAKEYIEKRWLEEFDLDEVADFVHLSRYHFARLFKKHTGMTPYSYYQDVRINRLKQALLDVNCSITEAFSACGMEYNGSMARLFKGKTGMTPSQYRKHQKSL